MYTFAPHTTKVASHYSRRFTLAFNLDWSVCTEYTLISILNECTLNQTISTIMDGLSWPGGSGMWRILTDLCCLQLSEFPSFLCCIPLMYPSTPITKRHILLYVCNFPSFLPAPLCDCLFVSFYVPPLALFTMLPFFRCHSGSTGLLLSCAVQV